jgi:hypothetical protein
MESLALVNAQCPEVQYFNELLVQYPLGPQRRIQQVVPDNMVVRCETPIRASGSFDLPLQPVGPFLVLEYVSKHNRRKDYEESFRKYERELKVPYYLLFYPDAQELTLFKLRARKYGSVRANAAGRHAIPELEIEVAILDGWVRYWFRGQLLPLPAELLSALDETRRQMQQLRSELEQARAQAERARAQAETERQEKERLLALLRERGIEPR